MECVLCMMFYFEWMFEFLHFCSMRLNSCGMLCSIVYIFLPQRLVVCSLLGLSCAANFTEVNRDMTSVGMRAWLNVKLFTIAIL